MGDSEGFAVADRTVLVLGGGIGGVAAASLLQERLKDQARVRLVERKARFAFPPSFPWLMLGQRTAGAVQRDMSALAKKGIDVVHADVTSIDVPRKSVGTTKGDLAYDDLVIALGAEYAPESIPGFAEHAHHVYDLDSALRFKKAVEDFRGGTIAVGIARLPFKCPAAPYEVALLLDDLFTRNGMRDRVKLEFFTPEGAPMPAAGPEIGGQVAGLLASRGIDYRPKRKLVEIGEREVRFEGGETLPYDLLFCVPPHRAPKPVVDAGLTDGTGWVPVDPATLETKVPGVYALGDVAAIPTPNGYVPFLPKAGVFAHGQAETVARNLAAAIKGRGTKAPWDGHGACFLETGRGQSAFVTGNFLAAPKPDLEFHMPGKVWHMQKVLFERHWFRRWF